MVCLPPPPSGCYLGLSCWTTEEEKRKISAKRLVEIALGREMKRELYSISRMGGGAQIEGKRTAAGAFSGERQQLRREWPSC